MAVLCNKSSLFLKKILMCFRLFSLLVLLSLTKISKASDSTRVLFIGNSITYFNNMPYTFQDISNNLGKKVKVTMYAPGGTGFVNHVSDPNVYNLFRNNWDVVVLQPGSNESAGTSASVNTTIGRGKTLIDSIKKYSVCAKVFLYQIPYGVPSSTTWNTYFTVQTMFRDSVGKMADSLKVPMIAAGECVRAYYTKYQNLALHGSYNDIHPNSLGSYLIACAAYNSIFQDTIKQCTYYETLHQDTAHKFFAISDSVILKNKTNWRINTYNLHADFISASLGSVISFTNSSTHFNSVLWKFGDGNTSLSLNPQHTYSFPGTYTVTLYAIDVNCTDSVSKVITINSTGIVESDSRVEDLLVYPNPTVGSITIKHTDEIITSIKVFDVTGKELISKSLNANEEKLDLQNFDAGVYFIEVNKTTRVKIIKVLTQ